MDCSSSSISYSSPAATTVFASSLFGASSSCFFVCCDCLAACLLFYQKFFFNLKFAYNIKSNMQAAHGLTIVIESYEFFQIVCIKVLENKDGVPDELLIRK